MDINKCMFSVYILFNLLFQCCFGKLQCKDESDNAVDWYVLYKIPQNHQHPNQLIKEGLAYSYITSNSIENGWMLSGISIGDSNSIPGRTLQPLYESKNNSLAWILYNDQPPNGTYTITDGHTKGVVLVNKDSGIWLIHSVPHFPPAPNNIETLWEEENDIFYWQKFLQNEYAFPETGARYGQSFLCLTLNSAQLSKVGIQLKYNRPHVFNTFFSQEMAKSQPELYAAADKEHVTSAPWSNIEKLEVNEQYFISFAKSEHFGKDLYSDWVANVLQSDLYVETWCNGVGVMTSDCSKTYKTKNVEDVDIKIADANFSSHHDHSKWAIAVNKNWTCVGDINRMEDQLKRGGGTVCFNNFKIWKAYYDLVSETQDCPKL